MIFPITFKKSSPAQAGHFPLEGMTILGIDTSFWDLLAWDPIKRCYVWKATWKPAQTPNILMHIRKSSQAGFQDPAYLQSLANIPHVRYNTSFHFFDPRANVLQQANIMLEKWRIGNYNLPPVLDVEWAFQFTRRELTSKVLNCLYAVDNELGMASIVYTGPYFWNDHLEKVDMNDHPLWIANYYVQKPMLPRGWNDWTIWQYSAKGSVQGLLGSVDMNYAKADKLDDILCDPIPQPPEFPKLYVVVAYALNVRSGPGTNYPIQRAMTRGTYVSVQEIAADTYGNAWGKVSADLDEWSCIMFQSNVYMRQV